MAKYCPFCGHEPTIETENVWCRCGASAPADVWEKRTLPITPKVIKMAGIIETMPRGTYKLWPRTQEGTIANMMLMIYGASFKYNDIYRAICFEREHGRAKLEKNKWTLLPKEESGGQSSP